MKNKVGLVLVGASLLIGFVILLGNQKHKKVL